LPAVSPSLGLKHPSRVADNQRITHGIRASSGVLPGRVARRLSIDTAPQQETPMKKTLALVAAIGLLAASQAHANDPKVAIAALDARLAKIGAPKLEGSDKAGEKTVPAIFFGARKINNNYDVVDEIKKSTGASATVFVKEGDDFIRVSTNVLTPEGKRGVGTPLARAKAYEAVSKGESYCGQVDVLGTPFDACYNPTKDAGGKVIGVSYVGYKK
jgi:Cache 3/Cache 2 fusion domain